MNSARLRLAAVLAMLCAGVAVIAPSMASADPTWRLEQPAPPDGAPFSVPLGAPGDLRFLGGGRGLLSIEGNSTVARGLLFYDGAGWRRLATVCGGSADTSRIAWAGPAEFWTVTEPSRPRAGSGTSLCHFKDGAVVQSYSTADNAVDPYRQLGSAACNGAGDCWFGGVGSQDPLGTRVGAFHLHWDGADLKTIYAPQGRGVSALTYFGGRFLETSFVGRGRENRTEPVDLEEPEDRGPRLLRTIGSPATFANEPFVAARRPGVTADGTELLAIDSDGERVWAGGGGAASGPSAPLDSSVQRPPIAVRRFGDFWQEVPLDESQLRPGELITSIAAMPGSEDAIATLTTFADRRSTTAKARVARITPSGGVTIVSLPVSGAGRGSAARVACPAPEECWMATAAGWLFHLTDGTSRAPTTDPAFAQVISQRPNEAAAQFVPDAPPVDDSQLFAPPPEATEPAAGPGGTQTAPAVKAKPVITNVAKPRLRSPTRLVVSFTVKRKARIGMIGYRGKRVVTRAASRLMTTGRRSLVLKLSRRRSSYPTRLRFVVRVPGEDTTAPGADGDAVITTGGENPAPGATTPEPAPAVRGALPISLGARWGAPR